MKIKSQLTPSARQATVLYATQMERDVNQAKRHLSKTGYSQGRHLNRALLMFREYVFQI
jgi:hypothetical protein